MIACRPIVGQNGFGNEFLNVAKALVCSHELGATFYKPRWPAPYERLLTREYNEHHLLRHRLRWLRYKLTHRWVDVDQQFCEQMGDVTISEGVKNHMRTNNISPSDNVVFRFSYFPSVRLHPGIGCVMHRMDYLKAVLLSNPDISGELRATMCRLDRNKLTVGVHIRRGDFLPEVPLGVKWPVGTGGLDEWCNRVPIVWFRHLCTLFKREFGDAVQFFLSSNGSDAEVAEVEREFACIRGVGQESRTARDVVDLLSLAHADIIIPSPSWFSLWALSFSKAPFFWYDSAYSPPEYLSRHRACFPLLSQPSLPRGMKEYAHHAIEARRFSHTPVSAQHFTVTQP